MTGFAVFWDGWPEALPSLLSGLLMSVKLAGASLAVGLPFGLLLAVLTMSGRRPLRALALAVVEVGRGAPLLVLLSLVYFGLPEVDLTVGQFLAATVAFGWSTGAYTSEIFRAGLEAVPEGQREAAAATGLSRFDAFRSVLLPQALRIAIPPLMGVSIQIFQITSLAFVIALPELMSKAYLEGSVTFRYLSVFLLAAVLYCAVCLPASLLVGLAERRLSRHLERGAPA